MAFIGTSNFSVEGDANNYVHGDQIVHYTTQVIHQGKKKHKRTIRTLYDEFYDIKLGAIHRIRDIYRKDYPTPRRWDIGTKEWQGFQVERIICVAEIRGEQPEGSRFTVVSYSGLYAKKAWKKDFQRFSKATDATKMQLFGINRSSVPLLIFFGELVPLAHLWERLGDFGRGYAYTLAMSVWLCRPSEVWIDLEKGTLVCGMEGPDCDLLHFSINNVETLPSSIEFLLQEDVCIRYFSQLPLVKGFDMDVIDVLNFASVVEGRTSPIINRPYILSTRTNSIIAIGNGVWNGRGCLDHYSRVVMPDGRTRFTLTDKASSLNLYSRPSGNQNAWFSQASNVFHRLGISLDEDLSSYKLIVPHIALSGIVNWRWRPEQPPVYFFLHPLPFSPSLKAGSVVSTHTWSFDENGQTPISRHRYMSFGLPTELRVDYLIAIPPYWPKETYKSTHKWQIARGFDPTTTDFARYLDYPIYEVLLESEAGQFEELSMDRPEGLSGRSFTEESTSQQDQRQYSTMTAYNTEADSMNVDSPTASPFCSLSTSVKLQPGAGDNVYQDMDMEVDFDTTSASNIEVD
ncbi:hypothetical protein E1B28_004947 [Marasmius oreades]|uniref:Uncharacterized protein n=1 Tax=Marasmius oreades TaxID=181124 RepID=A0A9P7UZP3_9AGAR|nr:uncharacterized protein E1B28_004947 [Marasmius oreades]KAG7097613.1 hypothetical protein E1B28_004947 [Marasmius oreades]